MSGRGATLGKRLQAAAVIALGVAVFGAAAWVMFGDTENRPQTPSAYTPPPEPTPAPLAVFLGDSYTVGEAAGDPAAGFAPLVAEAMDWRADVLGESGTGYLSAGSPANDFQAYPARAASLPEDANVVIISGGVNDASLHAADPDAFADAVQQTLAAARASAPDARLVVVGPFWPFDPTDSNVRVMNQVVATAAQSSGAEFIDPLGENWMAGVELAADGLHPTAAGHAALAELLVAALS